MLLLFGKPYFFLSDQKVTIPPMQIENPDSRIENGVSIKCWANLAQIHAAV
jgi:hypothetical protein